MEEMEEMEEVETKAVLRKMVMEEFNRSLPIFKALLLKKGYEVEWWELRSMSPYSVTHPVVVSLPAMIPLPVNIGEINKKILVEDREVLAGIIRIYITPLEEGMKYIAYVLQLGYVSVVVDTLEGRAYLSRIGVW